MISGSGGADGTVDGSGRADTYSTRSDPWIRRMNVTPDHFHVRYSANAGEKTFHQVGI
jgi:hypothetical protein